MLISAINGISLNRSNRIQANNGPKQINPQSQPKMKELKNDTVSFKGFFSSAPSAEEKVFILLEKAEKYAQNDMKFLMKRLNETDTHIKYSIYDHVNEVAIPPAKHASEQVGLNKVVARSVEKYDLLRDVVLPVVNRQKDAQGISRSSYSNAKLPGGVLLQGDNATGKTFMARSLLEHLNEIAKREKLNLKTVEISHDWKNSDTKSSVEALWKPFEEARKNHAETGNQTVIFINNFDDLMNAKNADMLHFELDYQTKNLGNDGITWIATITDKSENPVKHVGKSLILPTHLSDEETTVLFNHLLANKKTPNGMLDSVLDSIPIEVINDKKIDKRPGEINNFVNSIDSHLRSKYRKSYYRGWSFYQEPMTYNEYREAANNYVPRTEFNS